jgi:hypothetical protein
MRRTNDVVSSGLRGELSAESSQSLARDFREPFERTFSALIRRHELFGDETTHFVAAAVRCLHADLVEHIFETRLEPCGDLAHDCHGVVWFFYAVK